MTGYLMSNTQLTSNYLNEIDKSINQKSVFYDLFKKNGFPTSKNENWKYTPFSLFPDSPSFGKLKSSVSKTSDNINNQFHHLVIENNIISDRQDLSDEFELSNNKNLCADDFDLISDSLNSLTQTIASQKINLVINKTLKKPLLIELNYDCELNAENWCSNVFNIKLNKNVHASIIIKENGRIATSSTIFNFELSEYSILNHLNIVQNRNRNLSSSFFTLQEDSYLNSFTKVSSTVFSKQILEVNLKGKNAIADLNGLFETENENFSDILTLIKHNSAHTNSNQLFKGIARDKSRSVYNGKVFISKDCSKCNTTQLSRNLIKDKSARIYSRPQLEVYNDDVTCSHGSTFGQLSDSELFYLISRGIDKNQAEKLLQSAYYNEAIELIKDPEIKLFAKRFL